MSERPTQQELEGLRKRRDQLADAIGRTPEEIARLQLGLVVVDYDTLLRHVAHLTEQRQQLQAALTREVERRREAEGVLKQLGWYDDVAANVKAAIESARTSDETGEPK